jgi:ABC-type transport system substrate-binding protein
MNRPYFLAEIQLGTFWMMPKHILDPKNLTDKYTFAETNDLDAAQRNSSMKEFADWFNSAEVKRGIKLNIGSGPYVFESWSTGESVILKRNERWWNKGKDEWNPSYSDKLIFKIVNDRNTAVVALKNQELDFMEYVPPPKYTEEIDTVAVPHLAKFPYEWQVYTYIGWNTQSPVLSDKYVRKALSHLVDRNALLKQILRGIGKLTNSPIYPNSVEYDKSIKPIPYDPAKARELLKQAGWVDANNDGFLDKEINGKRMDLEFKFLLNAGNEAREQVALVLVDEFKKGQKIRRLYWFLG